VAWLARLRRTIAAPDKVRSAGFERASPGLAALFAGLTADGVGPLLDLGPAADSSLQVFGRYTHRVRFADLLGAALAPSGWSAASEAIPAPNPPYDVVLAWDVLDRLPPDERPALIAHLAEITSPGARLHVVADAPEKTTLEPLRFALLDVDSIRCEPTGRALPAYPRILPGQVERLLAPFRVAAGFTLKVGVREYVAVRR
jgi:hypothetical protein